MGSLKIPKEWINEAKVHRCCITKRFIANIKSKATYAMYEGDVFGAYELYMDAKVHRMAHELAINYLAPEAILREDYQLLQSLFNDIDQTMVDDFFLGGQVSLFAYVLRTLGFLSNLCSCLSTTRASSLACLS